MVIKSELSYHNAFMASGSSALKIPAKWNFSMALGDIIHVLGWPRCGLCCDDEKLSLCGFIILA